MKDANGQDVPCTPDEEMASVFGPSPLSGVYDPWRTYGIAAALLFGRVVESMCLPAGEVTGSTSSAGSGAALAQFEARLTRARS